eukprot:TRINITY_DN47342_c0_g1_i1.p1 TRINITY_DN47342_c0_g1~~TRINITY_DN47342_c0_g1_i1.p1  ORF type:complete len:641 (-),score=153.88 TRINITY_DN47342_c0_g1_i1:595-2517(-)
MSNPQFEKTIVSYFLPSADGTGPASAAGAAAGTPADSAPLSPEDALRRKLEEAGERFLRDKRVGGKETEKELACKFNTTAVPDSPHSMDEYMDRFVHGVVESSTHVNLSTFIGHMTSSLPYFSRPLSKLVATMNQNIVKTETGMSVTFVEREVLAMMHRLIYARDDAFYAEHVQKQDTTLGVFTSGGTLANITGLWVARNVRLGPSSGETSGSTGVAKAPFAGVESEGLHGALQYYGYRNAVVIGSELMHYSMEKAVGLLGLGTGNIVKIPTDADYRMDVGKLSAKLAECKASNVVVLAVIGIAGATETGAIDPLQEIAALCADYQTHFHVDAAWGGPLLFSREFGTRLAGMEKADSVTLDGHKQLYMPMGCGLLFLKDPDMCLAVRKTARYIIRTDSFDLGKFTLEGSRPANAVYLHTNLHLFGRRGFEALMNRGVRLARFMAKEVVKSQEFELLVRPMMNILLYRAIPPHHANFRSKTLTVEDNEEIDAYNIRLQTEQKQQGRTFVSRTTVPYKPCDGAPVVALRVVLANPVTQEADIVAVLDDQRAILQEINTGRPVRRPPTAGDLTDSQRAMYWRRYWDNLPASTRLFYKDDFDAFLDSLIAPSCSLEMAVTAPVANASDAFSPTTLSADPSRPTA